MKKTYQGIKVIVIINLFFVCFVSAIAHNHSPLSIEVFTDSLHQQLKGINLNQAAQKAKFIFQQNKKALQQAYHGLVAAQQYHLTQFPAFVFDHGNTIVYGQIDINQALFNYRLEKQTP